MDHYQDICISVAMIVGMDDSGEPVRTTAEDRAFEVYLEEAGYTPQQCQLARALRSWVLDTVQRMRTESQNPKRGDDPRCCDPGGGMRHPDEWDEDGDW